MNVGSLTAESVGVVINVLALAVAYLSMRGGQKRDRDAAEEKINKRHQENQELMTQIRIQIEGLKHLDPCLDDLKAEVTKLHERVDKVEGSMPKRETDILRALEQIQKEILTR